MPVPLLADDRLPPFAPTAVRRVTVFGAPAELVLVPSRKNRPGRAGARRPAFSAPAAERIVREEAVWRGDGIVLTPNRYPFAAGASLLWPEAPSRDPSAELWLAAAEWAARTDGSALRNDVGAAATIARAHLHLTRERQPFLDALPERPFVAPWFDVAGATLVEKRVPFCLLGVRGAPEQLAVALQRLAEARLTAAWNVVIARGAAWLMPRGLETPAPHFPYALGAAELWGRWCYVDEQPFAAATGDDLERALVAAGLAPLST